MKKIQHSVNIHALYGMKKFLYVCIMLVSMSLSMQLLAQSPQVVSTNPNNSAVDVSLTTTIDVKVNYPIVTSKLDTVVPSKNFLNQRYSGIYLVEKEIYDSSGGNINVLRHNAKSGHISTINDTTVRLTVNSSMLYPNIQYMVVVDSLHIRKLNGYTFDTLVVPQYTFSFRTVPPPYKVNWCNMSDKGHINCIDTIKVSFNRKLTSTTTDSGSIVSFMELQSRTYQLDSIMFSSNFIGVSSTSWLSPDSMSIYAIPSSLNQGTPYHVKVNTSYLTGNTDDDVSYGYRKASHATVSPSVSFHTSPTPIPEELKVIIGNRAFSMYENDTLKLKAPSTYGDFYFKKWESQALPTINNLTSNNVSTVLSCSKMRSLDYKAVYYPMTLDTVQLNNLSNFTSSSSNGYAKLTVTGFKDSLGGGVYTVVRKPNSSLVITVVQDSGFIFQGWTSTNYSPVNGSTSNRIVFIPGISYLLPGIRYYIGNIGIVPWGPTILSPCPNYSITVTAIGDKIKKQTSNPLVMISMPVLTPNSPYNAQATIANNQPFTQPVAFTVIDPCVEIQAVYLDGRLMVGTTRDEPTGIRTWNDNIRVEDPCNRTVIVVLQYIKYRLTIEHQTSDQSIVRRNVQWIERSLLGKVISTSSSDPVTGYYTTIVEYNCGDVVDLTPMIGRDLKDAVQFDEWYCAVDYTCAPIIDVPKFILRVVMDEDRKVRFLWKEDFYLRSVNVYYDPEGMNQFKVFEVDDEGSIIKYEEFAKEITAIKEFMPDAPVIQFQFSHDADQTTLSGTNPTNAGLYITEEEGLNNKSSNCHDLATYYYQQGANTRRVKRGLYEMDMVTGVNNSIKLWKAMKIEIFWTDRIKKDGTNTVLKNPGSGVNQTVLPEVKVELIDFTLLKARDCGDDDPAIYVTGGFVKVNQAGIVFIDGLEYKTHRAGYWEENLCDNDVRSINSQFNQFKPVSRKDVFVLSFIGRDIYCGDDTENSSSFFDDVSAAMKKKVTEGTSTQTLESKLVDLGVWFLAELGKQLDGGWCGDESYGQVQVIANMGNHLWLGRDVNNNPCTERINEVSNHHYKVRYKVILQ